MSDQPRDPGRPHDQPHDRPKDTDLPDRGDQEHPDLTPDEDKEQRGDVGPDAIGHTDRPKPTDADPGFTPDPHRGDEWRGWIGEIGREHRPRREDVYPYLLIRAMAPGDRGQRPLWPPIVCWESPDILLVDASYTGEFTTSQLVASPTAGRSYRVFVRVWNLGLLPGIGVHVRAWFVNPGFFGPGGATNPYYAPQLIGGAMVNLDDRSRPGCVALVELDQQWHVGSALIGHGCMIASASCPLDQWSGSMSVNDDRHVGQRNLTVAAPSTPLKALVGQLGTLVPKGGFLELTHGGLAARPMLTGVTGGVIRLVEREELATFTIEVADHRTLPFGVDIGASQHLLTAFEIDGRAFVVDSGRLAALAKEVGVLERRDTLDRDLGRKAARKAARAVHPFARAGGVRAVIDAVGLDRVAEIALVLDGGLADAVVDGMARMFDLDDLTAGSIGSRLGSGPGTSHLLRFTCTDDKDALVGGYAVTVIAG